MVWFDVLTLFSSVMSPDACQGVRRFFARAAGEPRIFSGAAEAG
jgi:hypothetical protein